MRNNYNSFEYWEGLIEENKTLRGNIFMDKLPTDKSIFIHTLIFSADNGLTSYWSYFPNEKLLLGYIQYCFLQEAFYKWIYGKSNVVNAVPNIPIDEIIKRAKKQNKLSIEDEKAMIKELDKLKKLWVAPKKKFFPEMKKFTRNFNKTWYGNKDEFIYMKVFSNAVELGEFVINSAFITEGEEVFKERLGLTVDEWRHICELATTDMNSGDIFREKLLKNLSEVI